MTNERRASNAIDVKVTVPELDGVPTFWMRAVPTHLTLGEFYQECVNHSELRRAGTALERVRASRHFWLGDRFLRRTDTLDALTEGRNDREIALTLRRDFYFIGPKQSLAGSNEYTYVDTEDRVDRVVPRILSKQEQPRCFDLCDRRGRRLDPSKSLADYELWPAWEDRGSAFPDRAVLRLRPRTGWLAYALLAVAAFSGLAFGDWLWIVKLAR